VRWQQRTLVSTRATLELEKWLSHCGYSASRFNWRFRKPLGSGHYAQIDLLCGPPDHDQPVVTRNGQVFAEDAFVSPSLETGVSAIMMRRPFGVERNPVSYPLGNGAVLLPNTFAWLCMKLDAAADWHRAAIMQAADAALLAKHAVDCVTLVCTLTEEDILRSQESLAQCEDEDLVRESRDIAQTLYSTAESPGWLATLADVRDPSLDARAFHAWVWDAMRLILGIR
jgi:hypothetical protein